MNTRTFMFLGKLCGPLNHVPFSSFPNLNFQCKQRLFECVASCVESPEKRAGALQALVFIFCAFRCYDYSIQCHMKDRKVALLRKRIKERKNVTQNQHYLWLQRMKKNPYLLSHLYCVIITIRDWSLSNQSIMACTGWAKELFIPNII